MAFGNQGGMQPLIDAYTQAAGLRSNAAQQAGQLGVQGLQQAGQQIGAGNVAGLQYSQPYIQAGEQALGGIGSLMGFGGADPQAALEQTPGYQFAREQGLEGISRQGAQMGKLYSGQTMKEMAKFGTGLASQTYQQQVGNLMNLLGRTGPFAQPQAGQEFAMGGQLGQLAAQRGQVAGEAGMSSAEAQAQGLLGAGQAQATAAAMKDRGTQLPLGQANLVGGSTSPWGNTVGGKPRGPVGDLLGGAIAPGVSARGTGGPGGSSGAGGAGGGAGMTGPTGPGTTTGSGIPGVDDAATGSLFQGVGDVGAGLSMPGGSLSTPMMGGPTTGAPTGGLPGGVTQFAPETMGPITSTCIGELTYPKIDPMLIPQGVQQQLSGQGFSQEQMEQAVMSPGGNTLIPAHEGWMREISPSGEWINYVQKD